MFERTGFDYWVADTFVLYGAPTVNGSLRAVRPGETVVVRMAGTFSGNGYQDARNPVLFPTPGLRITVELSMSAPDDQMFRLAETPIAENSLPITMLSPTR